MILRIYWLARQFFSAFFANTLPSSACRFTPTCSVYCAQAIHKYGIFLGTTKCFWRILKCHPFSRGSYDPV